MKHLKKMMLLVVASVLSLSLQAQFPLGAYYELDSIDQVVDYDYSRGYLFMVQGSDSIWRIDSTISAGQIFEDFTYKTLMSSPADLSDYYTKSQSDEIFQEQLYVTIAEQYPDYPMLPNGNIVRGTVEFAKVEGVYAIIKGDILNPTIYGSNTDSYGESDNYTVWYGVDNSSYGIIYLSDNTQPNNGEYIAYFQGTDIDFSSITNDTEGLSFSQSGASGVATAVPIPPVEVDILVLSSIDDITANNQLITAQGVKDAIDNLSDSLIVPDNLVNGSDASSLHHHDSLYYRATVDSGFAAAFSSSAGKGGAIGYGSSTISGGAVGSGAQSETGFAGGDGASSANGGAAVGEGAESLDGGGAVGNGADAGYGGAVGNGASTTSGGAVGGGASSETGFAGGYGASSDYGGAVGGGAQSETGFAGGSGALSSNGGGAVGSGAESLDGGGAVGNGADAGYGGAVGNGASTTSGGAVGGGSQSGTGFAGGSGASSANGGAAVGEGAESLDGGGAVGNGADAGYGGAVGNFASTTSGGAVGDGANSGSGFAGGYGTSSDYGGVVGQEAESTNGFAGGYEARSFNGGAAGQAAESTNGFAGGYEARSVNGGAAVGEGAESLDGGGAVGNGADAGYGGAVGNGASTMSGGAVGGSASSETGFAGGDGALSDYGGAIGVSTLTISGGAVGQEAESTNGFAGGANAKALASLSVQLSSGTNNNDSSLQFMDWQVVNSYGIIPSERLQIVDNLSSTNDTLLLSANQGYVLDTLKQDKISYKSNFLYPIYNELTYINDTIIQSGIDSFILVNDLYMTFQSSPNVVYGYNTSFYNTYLGEKRYAVFAHEDELLISNYSGGFAKVNSSSGWIDELTNNTNGLSIGGAALFPSATWDDKVLKVQTEAISDIDSIQGVGQLITARGVKEATNRERFKAHRQVIQEGAVVNTWNDCDSFSVIVDETYGGAVELLSDNQSFLAKETGFYQFGGCVHVQNNTTGIFTSLKVLTRLTQNGSEMRCSQRGFVKGLAANGGEEVLSYNGTAYLISGDTVKLQYYTDNANLDFYSSSDFEYQVAYTIWFIKNGY